MRIFARFKAFKRLYVDDAFVIFALTLALASAIVWQIFAKDMFQLMAVASGQSLPGRTFVADSEDFAKASIAVNIFFFSSLWAIKISFLVFFKRLVKNVRRQELLWWPIFGFTVATYFASVGTISYGCLTLPIEEIMAKCSRDSAVSYQQIMLKLTCAWDVTTDFLSSPPFSVLGDRC
jgi:hypothetical protein